MGELKLKSKHRLLCGDSTSQDDVARLMDGGKIESVVTDPPYGIGIDGQKMSKSKNPKHNRKAHNFRGWDKSRPNKNTFTNLVSLNVPIAIFGGNYFADLLPASRGWVYWCKGQDGLTMSDGELAWTNKEKPLRRVEANRALIGNTVHPTQKPLKVILFLIEYLETSGNVYDPFLGSGTTLIACEQLNRQCYGMEIDPLYCDVIVKRWENLTGETAHLESVDSLK